MNGENYKIQAVVKMTYDIQEETKKRLRKIMKERFDIDKKDIEFVPLSH